MYIFGQQLTTSFRSVGIKITKNRPVNCLPTFLYVQSNLIVKQIMAVLTTWSGSNVQDRRLPTANVVDTGTDGNTVFRAR